jgi:RimJ/RimL family protein N-acetyltransferase
MRPTPLSAEGVSLVPYESSHDARTVAWLNSDELRRTFGLSRDISIQSHRRWVSSVGDTLIWAILDGGTDHCGNTLLHCQPRHRSAYFQIYIGESAARGKGIGRATLDLVLAEAFGTLDIHRVWLHTLIDNHAAESLYQSAGFVDEGIERDCLLRDGIFTSQRRWSLLEGEWISIHDGGRE